MSDKDKPIMIITFKGILSYKYIDSMIESFKQSGIGKYYHISIIDQQDKAEVRIITDHIKP